MKKIVAFPLTWLLYGIGHLVSKLLFIPKCPEFIYNLYSTLMIWSSDVQDWAGLSSPWSDKNK